MATHSSILAWKFHGQGNLVDNSPWDHRVGHHRARIHTLMHECKAHYLGWMQWAWKGAFTLFSVLDTCSALDVPVAWFSPVCATTQRKNDPSLAPYFVISLHLSTCALWCGALVSKPSGLHPPDTPIRLPPHWCEWGPELLQHLSVRTRHVFLTVLVSC